MDLIIIMISLLFIIFLILFFVEYYRLNSPKEEKYINMITIQNKPSKLFCQKNSQYLKFLVNNNIISDNYANEIWLKIDCPS